MSRLPSCVAAPKRMEGVTRLFCRAMAADLAGEGEHEMEVNALERLSATLLNPLGVGGELALGAVAAVAAAAALLDGWHHALLEIAQGPLLALAEDVGDFEERLLQSASCPARRRLSRSAVAPGSLRRCRMRGPRRSPHPLCYDKAREVARAKESRPLRFAAGPAQGPVNAVDRRGNLIRNGQTRFPTTLSQGHQYRVAV